MTLEAPTDKNLQKINAEKENLLIDKVMELLNTKDRKLARKIVITVSAEIEGETCLELTEELRNQSKEIDYYVQKVKELETKITKLEISSNYRNGSTKVVKEMNIGESKFFPCGQEFNKIRKRLWSIAKASGIKVKTRAIQKNGSVGLELTRLT